MLEKNVMHYLIGAMPPLTEWVHGRSYSGDKLMLVLLDDKYRAWGATDDMLSNTAEDHALQAAAAM